MVGWTVGGGIEVLLGHNWLARAQYRYSDYGHVSNTDTFGGGGSFLRIVSTTTSVNTHILDFGLAYKF
jgi:outer membrane immunogenic protein